MKEFVFSVKYNCIKYVVGHSWLIPSIYIIKAKKRDIIKKWQATKELVLTIKLFLKQLAGSVAWLNSSTGKFWSGNVWANHRVVFNKFEKN